MVQPHFLKHRLSRRSIRLARLLLGPPARLLEGIVWGTSVRERVLLFFLGAHYRSVGRRSYLYAAEASHFTNQRLGYFRLGFGRELVTPWFLNRGFLSAEVIKPNDRVLDIGCGDGFFTRRFLGPSAALVDGIDVEPSAIKAAHRQNAAPNVRYHLLDATRSPFPEACYDVIIWDGALGHFAPETTAMMLDKISRALTSDGVFAGSESLGREGSDHLQFFHSTEDLAKLFKARFRHVQLRTMDYAIGGGHVRTEAYWRCANELGLPRLGASWTTMS